MPGIILTHPANFSFTKPLQNVGMHIRQLTKVSQFCIYHKNKTYIKIKLKRYFFNKNQFEWKNKLVYFYTELQHNIKNVQVYNNGNLKPLFNHM